MEYRKITVRANGKCHPAIEYPTGFVAIVCRCPGTQNGSLIARSVKVADGHDAVTCRK